MAIFSPNRLKLFLIFLGLFNIIDGLATLIFLNSEIATELNPLLNWGFAKSAFLFLFIKGSLVSGGMGLLWFARKSKYINVTKVVFVLSSIYACLFVYELVFLFWSLTEMNVCK